MINAHKNNYILIAIPKSLDKLDVKDKNRIICQRIYNILSINEIYHPIHGN